MSEEPKLDNHVAITTSIIAVFLAISSIMGNNADNDSILLRSQANDQWAYYQSKSMKQHMYETNSELLALELKKPGLPESYTTEAEKTLQNYQDKARKYDVEKDEIKAKAEENEKLASHAGDQGDKYDLAEAFYQIAIILSAICLIAKNKPLWILSIILGVIAVGISTHTYFFV